MEYTNKKGQKYFLHTATVTLRGGNRQQTIYFFSKTTGGKHATCSLPSGYKVVENPKTGMPVLKKA